MNWNKGTFGWPVRIFMLLLVSVAFFVFVGLGGPNYSWRMLLTTENLIVILAIVAFFLGRNYFRWRSQHKKSN